MRTSGRKRPQELDAGDLGHVPVRQDQVGRLAVHRGEALLAVAGLDERVVAVAGLPQQIANEMKVRPAVVDHENS